ncbi:MAG: dTMP kinase [Betaproteobacteria bacterium]|nr:dTMP kinase [Betaproteobacteria bacterium]
MSGANASRGRFITLEGVDGAGKSTHVGWIAERIRSRGQEVVVTREPGGTPLGEQLRKLVLGEAMHIDTETLLMFAARREHLEQVIQPALQAGKWVISDRFTDATFAYQGGGRQMAAARIAILEDWVQGAFQPDLTFVFDVPTDVAAGRRGGREPASPGAASASDRFERENLAFFERVRDGYLRRAAQFPRRMKVINANRALESIQKELEEYLVVS